MIEVKKFIVIRNDIIIGVYVTSDGIDGARKSLYDIFYDSIVEVPVDAEINQARSVKEYDEKWELRPYKDRISDGLVCVPYGYVFADGELRKMTLTEEVKAGITKIPEGTKIENETFVQMSDDEMMEAGLIKKEQIEARNDEKLIFNKMYEMAREELRKEGKIR